MLQPMAKEWACKTATGYSGDSKATLRRKANKPDPSPASMQVGVSNLYAPYLTNDTVDMLKKPLAEVQPLSHTAPEPPKEAPKTQKEETFAKARIIFGSTTALAERKEEILKSSQKVAGVLVPPRPEEPDNCCMSGCVNCVWDMYRDEMEEWAEKSAQARAAMQAQRQEGKGTGSMVAGEGMPGHVATSMDDDGGGSETNWDGGLDNMDKDKLFDDIPVGIREFMRTEKKLKQAQKKAEAAAAA
jgi:hypothetical protein